MKLHRLLMLCALVALAFSFCVPRANAQSPDFVLTSSFSPIDTWQGANGTANEDTIYVADENGFSGTVTFTVSGIPANASYTLSPGSSTTQTVLTIDTPTSVSQGTYTVTVTGTSGTLVHHVNISLVVGPEYGYLTWVASMYGASGGSPAPLLIDNSEGDTSTGYHTAAEREAECAALYDLGATPPDPVASMEGELEASGTITGGRYTAYYSTTSGGAYYLPDLTEIVPPGNPPPPPTFSSSPYQVILDVPSDARWVWLGVIMGYAPTYMNVAGMTDYRLYDSSGNPIAVPTDPPYGPGAVGGTGEVDLTWTAPSGVDLEYNVYRGTSTGSETLYQAGVTSTSFTDMSVTSGTTYYYEITAANPYAESAVSSEVNATPS